MFSKKNDDAPICPLMKGACVKDKCMFWTHVQGQNPQSGATIDHFDCAVRWLPLLLIENSQQQRQTGAAVESLRNEGVASTDKLANALLQVAAEKSSQVLIGG